MVNDLPTTGRFASGRAVRRRRLSSLFAGVLTLSIFWPSSSRADLSLETETARPILPGHYELSFAGEYQKSSQGEEYDVPMALEFGVFKRFELLIEPVPYTRIRAPRTKVAQGLGDTEITATYLLLDEQRHIPAVAGAFEVKIPTAHNLQIGSRVADYRIYLAASKRWRDFDFHANIGYNIVGQPSGVRTKNPIDLEFAVEWFAHPKFDLFAEVNYVDSSRGSGGSTGESGTAAAGVARRGGRAFPQDASDGGGITSGPGVGGALTAEITGTEIVGTGGIRYHLREDVDLYGSVSYDNQNAILYRVGITYKH